MHDQYKKNAAIMSTILALVVVTSVMFITQNVYSSTRASIDWVTIKERLQTLDLSGIPSRTIDISYKATGSPFSSQFRSVYVAVTDSEKDQPEEWMEIQECRVWGKVDFWPQNRCTVTYPKVDKPSTLWIRVTTNNPDGSARCGYGVTPYPNGEYCGDAEVLSLPVTP